MRLFGDLIFRTVIFGSKMTLLNRARVFMQIHSFIKPIKKMKPKQKFVSPTEYCNVCFALYIWCIFFILREFCKFLFNKLLRYSCVQKFPVNFKLFASYPKSDVVRNFNLYYVTICCITMFICHVASLYFPCPSIQLLLVVIRFDINFTIRRICHYNSETGL